MALGHALTRSSVPIYVEHRIRAPLDLVWSHTQDPDLHERWDLRFTDIDYVPRSDPAAPQRFRYATRLGFGIAVVGEGETVGERDRADGIRVSALRFWSAQARSLIREGRGYWKYIPTDDGAVFITGYDYETRYGWLGRLVDRLVFRPLMGWATAWSFDRLRLWLESGLDPALAARQALAHGVARVGLAAMFLYHGLVPKLLGPDAGEIALMTAAGVPPSLVGPAIVALGLGEVAFGLVLLRTWHRAWPAALVVAFAVLATLTVALTAPTLLTGAFNPVSLNLAMACLAVVDRLTLADIPSAGRCRRRPASALDAAALDVGTEAAA